MDRNIIATQAALFQAAKRRRTKRFDRLARLIARRNWIRAAVHEGLRLPGAQTAGVDGKTRENFETLEQRQQLAEEVDAFLRGYYYLPSSMRPVRIPKRQKKGFRTILVPTILDRVIGHLLKAVLEPIFEADFVPFSQGYRPGRGRMDSIANCQHFISDEHPWVFLADIRECFFSLDQEVLIRLLRNRIADEKVVEMVRAFLEAGACDRGFGIELLPGAPAGFSLSPLLMNICLHEVDRWVMRQFRQDSLKSPESHTERFPKCRMTRYADNLLFVCDTEQDASCIRTRLTEFLGRELRMDLSQGDICQASEGFIFLGFHVQWTTNSRRGRLLATIPAERIARFKCEVTKIIRPDVEPIDMTANLHQAISSFGSEYRFVDSRRQFRILDRWIKTKLNERLTHGGAGNILGEPESIEGNRAAEPMRLCEIKREPYRPVHRLPFRGPEDDQGTVAPTDEND